MLANVSTLTWYLLITVIPMFSQNVFVASYCTGCVSCWRALNFSSDLQQMGILGICNKNYKKFRNHHASKVEE